MPLSLARRTPDPALAAAIDDLERAHAAVRSAQLACRYARHHLPKGRYYVFPAGRDAEAVLAALPSIPGLSIAGVIDRNAPTMRSFLGHPVITPAELPDHAFDRVLVCHPVREAELLDNLHSAGIPQEKIELLYGSPRYLDFCHAEGCFSPLPRRPGPKIRNVIVRAGRSGIVVDDDALGCVFPPSETVVLNAGLEAERIDSRIFPVVDLHGSLRALRFLLESLDPRTVYLQFNLHTIFLAAQVRRILPTARMIYEMWDLWRCSIDDLKPEHHGRLLGMSGELVDLNKRAETHILDAADLFVSKRGGARWETECRNFAAPCHQYFARIGHEDAPELEPAPGAGPLRIVFAATLQLPSVLAEFDYIRANQDHRAVFEALAATGTATVDIYNAGHQDQRQDPLYREYLDRYRDGPIRYHRRIPADALRQAMRSHHYGWIRATPAVPSVDCEVVIPASLSTYVSAGLPVIIDASLTHAATLVERFDAGIVIPPGGTLDTAIRHIRAHAAPARHRFGVDRLRAHMIEHNRDTIAALQAFVAA